MQWNSHQHLTQTIWIFIYNLFIKLVNLLGHLIGPQEPSCSDRLDLDASWMSRNLRPWYVWVYVCVWPYTDGVDVWLVASEGLSAHSFPDVPELGRGIASSRHKQPGVGCQRETHDITGVTSKCSCLLTSLNVPQSAGGKQNKHHQISADT